jgi:hypothetical protein
VGALKKPVTSYQKLYADSPSPEKKAVVDLKNKITGLLESDPRMARKAAQIIELWLAQKSNKTKKP